MPVATPHEEQNLQRHLYTIAVYEEDTILTDHTGQAEKRFVVTQDQLMRFFRTKIRFRPEPGLLWMDSDGHSHTYLFDLKAQKEPRTILVRDFKGEIEAYQIHIPGLLVRATLSEHNGRDIITGMTLACYAGRRWTPSSRLYELPLPNISGTQICMGSGRNDGLYTQGVKEAIEFAIFETPFNTHNDNCGRENLPFKKFHKRYGGRCPFHKLNKISSEAGRSAFNV